MILSAHQPAYLPWMGYFDKISRSDLFVFLDSVQFEKNSFTNRNQIKTQQGPAWLTIPVKMKGHLSSTLKETQIDNSQGWKNKHLKSIYFNYRKAPRFGQCYPKLEELYHLSLDLLSDLCFHHLAFWLRELGVQTRIERSSSLGMESSKSQLILDICKYYGADQYLSGKLGRNYVDEEQFKKSGIVVSYQDYAPAPYPQLYGEFIPNLSVIDQWMNVGLARSSVQAV